jgi:hypothetical protein
MILTGISSDVFLICVADEKLGETLKLKVFIIKKGYVHSFILRLCSMYGIYEGGAAKTGNDVQTTKSRKRMIIFSI